MNGELYFGGKKYISARRASEIIGYNSDYIGQLCRKGELDCRRVGRAWFVEESSLKSYHEVASKKPRGRIAIYQRECPVIAAVENVVQTVEEIIDEKSGDDSGPRSFDHEVSADLYINDVADRKNAHAFALRVTTCLVLVLLFVFSFPILREIDPVALRGGYENFSFKINKSFSNFVVPASLENDTSAVANVFSGSGETIKDYVSSLPLAIRTVRLKTDALTLSVYHHISIVGSRVADRMQTLATRSDRSSSTERRDGVVVVPATGDPDRDEQVKQYVKNSFSDETQITPDASGSSGVITPVFRNQNEDEYLYVIVPVVDE